MTTFQFSTRFQTRVRRARAGGFIWNLMFWDGSVARALGESAGWQHARSGRAKTREAAEVKARKAAEEWIWVEDNPEETVDEFELQQSPYEIEDGL